MKIKLILTGIMYFVLFSLMIGVMQKYNIEAISVEGWYMSLITAVALRAYFD